MIYRGTQKKMIMLKDPTGEYFDEAYFILKDSVARTPGISENDMVREANRIISDSLRDRKGAASLTVKKRFGAGRINWFCYSAGVLCGMAGAFLLCALFR